MKNFFGENYGYGNNKLSSTDYLVSDYISSLLWTMEMNDETIILYLTVGKKSF
jgi:hypothetical protein